MIADVLLNSLLQKQLADAVTKHTENGFERFSEDLWQEVSGIFALQIAAVKQNCFCYEFVLRAASVAFVVFLHPLPNCKLTEHSVVISKSQRFELLRKRCYIFKDEVSADSG